MRKSLNCLSIYQSIPGWYCDTCSLNFSKLYKCKKWSITLDHWNMPIICCDGPWAHYAHLAVLNNVVLEMRHWANNKFQLLDCTQIHSNLYNDVTMSAITSQITNLMIAYSTVYSGADQWQHQSSASLDFLWGIHQWLVNFSHKGPLIRKTFPFDDVIMFRANMHICTTAV